jgi:glycosyltransferase involved in cell wall biosynthesis
MRFVLVSTHVDQITGYSKVAHNMLKQLATLAPRVKTYHYGFQRHPARANLRKVPDGVIAYDAAANEDPKEEGFGFNKFKEYLDMVNPDVVMIYNDPLIIHKFLETIDYKKASSPFKLWVYVDQVYNGIANVLMDKLRTEVDRVYAFTDSWAKALAQYGTFPDVKILEHAVDPFVFKQLSDRERTSLRSTMNVPKDAVVFLNINRNSQRKRLDLTLGAFAELLSRRSDKPYYLILATGVNPQSGAYYDVQRIFQTEVLERGLPQQMLQRLLLVDTSGQNVLNDEAVNGLYNAADIGINTSDGEGFGLCQLEHMYTGAPQIVTDIGSYRSFLDESVAEFVKPVSHQWFAGGMPLGSTSMVFLYQDVASAMEKMVDALPEKKKGAASYTFKTWSQVCDGWLEDILTEAGMSSQITTVSVPATS